jgi:hypothetical protein
MADTGLAARGGELPVPCTRITPRFRSTTQKHTRGAQTCPGIAVGAYVEPLQEYGGPDNSIELAQRPRVTPAVKAAPGRRPPHDDANSPRRMTVTLDDQMFPLLLGAGIALVTSVAVTWIQGVLARRSQARNASREAIHQLWRLFIAERDATESTRLLDEGGPGGLGEAEILAATLADRRTRERISMVVKLLRECDLPEMEELSGIRAERARQMLCEHVLHVLGTQLRGERLPALPPQVKKLHDVEGEALNIHAGGVPSTTASATATPAPTAGSSTSSSPSGSSGAASTEESVPRSKVRRKPRTTQSGTDTGA